MVAKTHVPKKLRALIFVGGAVAILLVAGFIAWQMRQKSASDTGPIVVTGVAGTTQAATAHVQSPQKIDNASFAVTGDAGSLATVMTSDSAPVTSGQDVAVPLFIEIKSDKLEGSYKGSVELHGNGKTLGSSPITVNVQKATADAIPLGLVEPTNDRIITPSNSLPRAKDELVVGLNLNTIGADKQIKDIAKKNGAVIIGGDADTKSYQLRFDGISQADLAKKRDDFGWIIGVTSASYNSAADDMATPNDEAYFETPDKTDKPWLDASNNQRNWGQRYIGLPKAWDKSTGNSAVRVGIIDNGFDFEHPDLKRNIAKDAGQGNNIINQAISGYKKPHGTYVAGVACEEGDNKIGMAGVMWRCNLGLYDNAMYKTNGIFLSSAKKMMHMAAKENMKVVNMSFGWGGAAELCNGLPLDKEMRAEVRDANLSVQREIEWAKENKKDMLWVFAAGNSCRDTDEVAPAPLARVYPDNVIAVAAIGQTQNMASTDIAKLIKQSNYGPAVTVAAPGEKIYTTTYKQSNTPETNDSYYVAKSGTSLAAPFVTGLAGLVMSAHPDFTAKQVRQCIVDSANAFGHSVVDQASKPISDFKVISAPETLDCIPTPDPASRAGSSQPCVFSFATRPMKCESTNATVTVRFTNVAGSVDCGFESHLSWEEGKDKSPQVDKITGLRVNGWIELGTHAFTKPGKYLIGHTVTPLTSGPCTILPGLYEFTLLAH